MTLSDYLQAYLDHSHEISAFRIQAGQPPQMAFRGGWISVAETTYSAEKLTRLTRKILGGQPPTGSQNFTWNELKWSIESSTDPPAFEIRLLSPPVPVPELLGETAEPTQQTEDPPEVAPENSDVVHHASEPLVELPKFTLETSEPTVETPAALKTTDNAETTPEEVEPAEHSEGPPAPTDSTDVATRHALECLELASRWRQPAPSPYAAQGPTIPTPATVKPHTSRRGPRKRSAHAKVSAAPLSDGAGSSGTLKELGASLLLGRPGREIVYRQQNPPLLYLKNFPIAIGTDAADLGPLPPELEQCGDERYRCKGESRLCHWRLQEGVFYSDTPFAVDPLSLQAPGTEVLAERPGELLIRTQGSLRYLGSSKQLVELEVNFGKGDKTPQGVLRDDMVWALLWVEGSALGRMLRKPDTIQLIRYQEERGKWRGSCFGTFSAPPLWAISPQGQACGWVRPEANGWQLEIVDCQEEALLGEFTLPAKTRKPCRLLVGDNGNFALQIDQSLVVGETSSTGYRTFQLELEAGTEVECLGPYGVLSRKGEHFQHWAYQHDDAWSCLPLTLENLCELGRHYDLLHVPPQGPLLAYDREWMALPFECENEASWKFLAASLSDLPVSVVDIGGVFRFFEKLPDRFLLSCYRVMSKGLGNWSIEKAESSL